MSILSDVSIKELCTGPVFSITDNYGETHAVSGHVLGRVYPEWSAYVLQQVRDLPAYQECPLILPGILRLIKLQDACMITPFLESSIKKDERGNRLISKGLSSYGYDVSLSDEFKIFTNINSSIIDPKRFDERCLVDADLITSDNGEKYVLLPPNSYLLCRTNEYFNIPRDVMVVCVGKSTYARAGAIVNTTPIEPGFIGNVVIEISNSTNLPLKIYAHEGIAQFLFFKGDRPCEVSYADRGGKYQGQTGVQNAKV